MSSTVAAFAYCPVRWLYQRTKSGYQSLSRRFNILLGMAKMELQTGQSVSIPLRRRLWLWRRGFTSRFDVLFNVTEDNYHRFISDYQEGLTHRINEPWKAEMDNKLTAHLLSLPFQEHLPTLFGILDSGDARRYPAYEGGQFPSVPDTESINDFKQYDASSYIDSLLRAEDALVLKSLLGSGGRGVYVIRTEDKSDDYRVNGSTYDREHFHALITGLEEYLITEHVDQSEFMADLFPDSANTIRIVTMWDYKMDEPFIAWAHARIGTPESAPLDNISQGGLQAGLDVDTGELLYAADITDKQSPVDLEWYDSHPSTDTRIVGRSIPNWTEIADELVHISEGVPQFPYVGWDVLLTGDGEFKILELNSSPGMINTQVYSRVLDKPRVRRFYEHHGVL